MENINVFRLKLRAAQCHEVQTAAMRHVRRGWGEFLVEFDNDARDKLSLPVYGMDDSPVMAYVRHSNVDDAPLEGLLHRVEQTFGGDLAVTAQAIAMEGIVRRNEGERTAWAPPKALTYVMYRLDDPTTHKEPIEIHM